MLFGKRLSDLTKEDIAHLVDNGVQEGAEIEFKEAIPGNNGPENWSHSKNIHDGSRDQLLKHIVAFANAHGGVLVIGVRESSGKPSRAAEVVGIPFCDELVSRLTLQCSDVIDPPIPLLELHAVQTNEGGNGVVVARVPRSRRAPHRLASNRKAYVRRRDSSVEMDMREIQDLTLFVDRGLASIKADFKRQRDQFGTDMRDLADTSLRFFGLRATAIPLSPISVDRIYLSPDYDLPDISFKQSNGRVLQFRLAADSPVPILRGTRYVDGGVDPEFGDSREAYTDGVIEYRFWRTERKPDAPEFGIGADLALGIFLNTVVAAEWFRQFAGAPAVEYGLEFEIWLNGPNLFPITTKTLSRYGRGYRRSTTFPQYSIGPPSEFQTLSAIFEQDFWNGAGIDLAAPFVPDLSNTV